MRGSRQGSALGRMNSRNSRASLRESKDSQYNFKGNESRADDPDNPKYSRQNSVMSSQSKVSRHSKASGGSKASRRTSVVGGNAKKNDKASNQASKVGKMVEFAEDSAEDESSSLQSSDEEEKKRKWEENLYYYTCPVFRVSHRHSQNSNGCLKFKFCLYFNSLYFYTDDVEAKNRRN